VRWRRRRKRRRWRLAYLNQWASSFSHDDDGDDSGWRDGGVV